MEASMNSVGNPARRPRCPPFGEEVRCCPPSAGHAKAGGDQSWNMPTIMFANLGCGLSQREAAFLERRLRLNERYESSVQAGQLAYRIGRAARGEAASAVALTSSDQALLLDVLGASGRLEPRLCLVRDRLRRPSPHADFRPRTALQDDRSASSRPAHRGIRPGA